MNFNKKEDNGKPAIGNVSFSKKTSGFSVNNLGKASTTFMERIKNLSKKDIAFVAMGLSILVMAPLAEFFMTKPNSDNLLTPGFGERKAGDASGLNLYDSGVGGLSSGSPDGSSDVIVPLTARDPSSLIVGSQPSAPPPAPPSSSLRDSMRDVAPRAFSEAVKSSPAPFIPSKMSSSLRGMSSFFGGGESSKTSGISGGGKIIADAQGGSKKSEKRSMAGPVAIPGYKGVASNTPNSASKGALEKLRSQADKSAGFFSGGNAVKSLNDAAAASIGSGSGAGGLGGVTDSEKIKGAAGTSLRNQGSYSPGDPCRGSLAVQLACEEAKENARFWRQMKQGLITSAVDSIVKKGIFEPIGKKIADKMTGLLNPPGAAPGPIGYCKLADGEAIPIYSAGKDNNGQPTFTPYSPKDCPGVFSTKKPDSGPTNTNTNNNSSSGDTSTNVVRPDVPESFKASFEEHDKLLLLAMEDSAKGQNQAELAGDTGGKKLKTLITSVGGNLSKAMDIGGQLSDANKTVTEQASSQMLAKHNQEMTQTKTAVYAKQKEYRDFMEKLNAAIKKAESGKLVSEKTIGDNKVEVVETSGMSLKKYLETAKVIAERDGGKPIELAEKKVLFHEKAEGFYGSQTSLIGQTNAQVSADYKQKSSDIQTLLSQLPKDGEEESVEGKKALAAAYKKLTGDMPAMVLPQDVPTPIVDPTIDTSNIAKASIVSFRAAPASDEQSMLEMAVVYRGGKKEKAFEGGKFVDAEARGKEVTYFSERKPFTLLTKEQFGEINAQEIDKNLIAPMLRGTKSMPDDIDEMVKDFKVIKDSLAKINPSEWKENIKKEVGVSLDEVAPTSGGNTVVPNNGNGTVTPNNGTVESNNGQSGKTSDLSSQMTVVNNSLTNAQSRYDTAAQTNNCLSKACKTQLANANTSLGEMRTAQDQMVKLNEKMKTAKDDTEREQIRTQFEEQRKKFEAAEKKFDGKGLRTASDGTDSLCGQDINMACVEKRVAITNAKPQGTVNNGTVNPNNGNGTVTPVIPPVVDNDSGKKCYETKEGCKTVSSFAIVRKWKLMKAGTVYTWQTLWNKYMTDNGYKEGSIVSDMSVCEKFWGTITFGNSGYAGWKKKDQSNNERCAELLSPMYVLAGEANGSFASSANIQPLVFDRQNETRYATKDQSSYVFDRFNMLCEKSGNNWTVKEVRGVVKQSFTEGESNTLGLSLGFSKGVTGNVSYSHTWTKSETRNFSDPVIIYNGSPAMSCGTPTDKRDK